MPKKKTKKTLTRRVKLTKTGKLMKKKLRTSHLKSKWNANRKHRKGRKNAVPNKKMQKKLKSLLAK